MNKVRNKKKNNLTEEGNELEGKQDERRQIKGKYEGRTKEKGRYKK